jgi:sugar phosphate isomerase/epimerase
MSDHPNNYPKLHNAMWPGLVGKGTPGAEPFLDLDTMLSLTAAAEVAGLKFDGVDIFLYEPHINIDISDDDLKRVADKIAAKGLQVGSVVAPIWPQTGGGSAMGSADERKNFVGQVRKGCRIAAKLREFGIRPYGVVRLDTACSVTDWDKDPDGNTKLIAQTLREACDVAESFGERLAAEGEICWGGLHSWKEAVKLLELVGRPKTLGFQADMAHTLLYILGYNKPEDAILPPDWDWSNPAKFDEAYKTLTAALRPWTIDFHVAQNDATVLGAGTHEKTGHHCLATDPKGKLNIPHHAGFWMRDETGQLTKAFRHICWDGCMFPNAVMTQPQTWNDILTVMIAVRDAHGWREEAGPAVAAVLSTEKQPLTVPPLKAVEAAEAHVLKPAVAEPVGKAAAPARPPRPAVRAAPARPVAKPVKPTKSAVARPVQKAAKRALAKGPGRPAKKAAKPGPKKAGTKARVGKGRKRSLKAKVRRPAKKAGKRTSRPAVERKKRT